MQQGSARGNETAIGIDVGTTAVKAALVADDGQLLATHSGTYPITRKAGGIAEQNPEDWVDIIAEALQQFAAQASTDGICAVGLCSQVNTHVFVDEKGNPVMPAMLWQDVRASAEAAELDARVSESEKLAPRIRRRALACSTDAIWRGCKKVVRRSFRSVVG